ncbi:chemotaxis protein CheW [Aureimonas endophytica]|uniref:Chemotaxis protein CheW n=1 Tax=Aureimonas endophytica TaxID=2027858 RepID=A0A917A3S4_9HYPH|nr:chemotaxis protein CheW [Aureimonas endophytica]GGE25446.1 chemotaxis protein CheW [Aureimonas endophytica]
MSDAFESRESPQGGEDYLTVSLDDDLFAIRVGSVHEVLDPPPVTNVPNAPDFAPGLINVRGNILPLIDLRRRFDMHPVPDTEHTRVIVSRIEAGGDGFFVGIKADAVHEVLAVGRTAIEPLPENGTRWPTRFLAGVIRHENRFVILLDLERILGQSDTPSLH